jgi:hypothetical protein
MSKHGIFMLMGWCGGWARKGETLKVLREYARGVKRKCGRVQKKTPDPFFDLTIWLSRPYLEGGLLRLSIS